MVPRSERRTRTLRVAAFTLVRWAPSRTASVRVGAWALRRGEHAWMVRPCVSRSRRRRVAQLLVLVLEVEQHAHAGEVDAGPDELGDATQPSKVVGAVATGAPRGARRLEQAAGLEEAERGRRDADELGGHRDAVDATVTVRRGRTLGHGPVTSSKKSAPGPCLSISQVLQKIYRACH